VAGTVEDLAMQGDSHRRPRRPAQRARQSKEIEASGLAVAPGFIDMLNHAETSLIADGRSQSGIRQGVTLSVFGESSMGPLTDAMKQQMKARQADIKFDITWSTLGEYLDSLVARGVSTNVASFVSASTVRANVIGLDNRAPPRRSSTACARSCAPP
jgi:N-acyl-D-amino-acid deacylase